MSSDGENRIERVSPPTPAAVLLSPPTPLSPPTSPHCRSPATSSSSSPQATPVRPRRKRNLTRTSIQRKRRRLLQDSEESDEQEENRVAEERGGEEEHLGFEGVRDDNREDGAEDIVNRVDSPPVNRIINSSDDRSDEDTSDSDVTSSSASANSSINEHDPSGDDSADNSNSDSNNSNSDNMSDATVASLFHGSEMSSNQALHNVLKVYVEECWTKTSLDKNVKMIKKMLPQPNEFPASSRDALNKLRDLTSQCSEVQYEYCDDCLQLVSTPSDNCDHTGSKSKFYLFPIEEQIKHMFEQRGLASIIDSYREHPSKIHNHICDISDGSEYKKVKENLTSLYDLVLLWNTDGVALSSSSKQDLWPVLCTICEVPPRLRSSFIIVAGVYVSGKDPDMNVYFKPISDELKKLCESGLPWIHPVSKEKHTSKVVAPALSADAPAKAKVLQHKNHNYRFGCLVCEQKSKKIDRLPGDTHNAQGRRKPRLRRFVFQEEEARIRTSERLEALAVIAEMRNKSRKGVIGRTVVSDFPFFNRATAPCAEYMHLILLGCVKYFLLKIFEERGPWYVGNLLDEINWFIQTRIKVPDFINRRPRKAKDIKYWKASELLAFLLFYSLPIFRDKLPEPYFQHWLLLAGAVYILLKEAISEADLNIAEVMLRLFVREIGNLYGEKCYTYNVHNLLHVSMLVRRWGPLWGTSAFIFENCNGYLGKRVHGTKNLGQELISNLKTSQSLAVLDNILSAPPEDDYHTFRSRHITSEFLGKPLEKTILNYEEMFLIDSMDLGAYMLYKRAKIKSTIYSSKMYDQTKKRANSYIKFKNDIGRTKYGQIIVFLKSENSSLYCLVKVFSIVHMDLMFHQMTNYVVRHLLPVKFSDDLIVIPVESLSNKVLKIGNYIGIRPNSYENNL